MLANLSKPKFIRHNAQSVTSLPNIDTSHGRTPFAKDPSTNCLLGKHMLTPYEGAGTVATSMSLERLHTQAPTDSHQRSVKRGRRSTSTIDTRPSGRALIEKNRESTRKILMDRINETESIQNHSYHS